MNSNPESLLTDEDMEAITASLSEGEAPKMDRTLLATWIEVLQNAEDDRAERISPEAAMRALNSWPKLQMDEVSTYLEVYYDKLIALRQHIVDIVDEHPEALKNIEDDAEENHDLYIELLFRWQLSIARWEKEWDVDGKYAYLEIAATVDVSGTFLGVNGLSSHLTQIGMSFDEEEQAKFADRLREAVEEL